MAPAGGGEVQEMTMAINMKTPLPRPRPKTTLLFELPLPRRSCSISQMREDGYWRRCATKWKERAVKATREAEEEAALARREATELGRRLTALEILLAPQVAKHSQAAARIMAVVRGCAVRRRQGASVAA